MPEMGVNAKLFMKKTLQDILNIKIILKHLQEDRFTVFLIICFLTQFSCIIYKLGTIAYQHLHNVYSQYTSALHTVLYI